MINVCQFKLEPAGKTVSSLACAMTLYGATAAPILQDVLPPSTFPGADIEVCESFVAGEGGRAGVVASSARLLFGSASPYSVRASWKLTTDKELDKDTIILQVAYSGATNASGIGGTFYVMTADSRIYTVPVRRIAVLFVVA
jgi:hypothetical protein